MTPEEIDEAREMGAFLQDENGEVSDYWRKMLAHIDQQSNQITSLIAEIKEFVRIINESFYSLSCDQTGLNEHQDLPQGIGRMNEQIEALKAALIKAVDRPRGNETESIELLKILVPEVDWK